TRKTTDVGKILIAAHPVLVPARIDTCLENIFDSRGIAVGMGSTFRGSKTNWPVQLSLNLSKAGFIVWAERVVRHRQKPGTKG
ncbi:MAG: hypothetical protein AAFY03_11250, partial [Pseudomonadota bacterium]